MSVSLFKTNFEETPKLAITKELALRASPQPTTSRAEWTGGDCDAGSPVHLPLPDVIFGLRKIERQHGGTNGEVCPRPS